MYFVKYGEEFLHDPRVDEYHLSDLSLESNENTCGYCDFTIYPSHPMYNKLKESDSANPITVYDDDNLIFSGFIYKLDLEFYLNGNVKCKGELSYLENSFIRPYSTLPNGYGRQAPTTVDGYFAWLINEHNSQVNAEEQFTVGINQGGALDSNNYIYRESVKYPKTFDEIKEKLIDDLGGYLRVRHTNGIRYIDYLSEWTDTNTQVLKFGENLTDYTQTDDSERIATFIIPLGSKMSETDYSYNDGYFQTSDKTMDRTKEYYTLSDNGYTKVSDDVTSFESGVIYYEYYDLYDESNLSLTIAGLEDKTYDMDGYKKIGDIIYCEPAVKKYGWIGATYENEDITTKGQLITKSIIALKELISPKRTIEIKAVDMHLINPEMSSIRIGEYVRVVSEPHKLDSYFLCTSIDFDLNNPENSKYTFGTTFDTLTGQQNKRIKLLNDTINQTYEKAEKLTEKEKQNAQSVNEALKQSRNAHNTAVETKNHTIVKVIDQYAISEDPTNPPQTDVWTEETPDWEEGLFIWRRFIYVYGDGNEEIGTPTLSTGGSGKDGEDAVVVRIDSSRGSAFKNNMVVTVLSVVIYKGSQIISNSEDMKKVFGESAYLQWKWQRLDDDTFSIISSSDSRFGENGFTFTLSPDDVDTKVTFRCELVV